MSLIEPNAIRVNRHTDPRVNLRIAKQAAERLAVIGDDPQRTQTRLGELEREWDIERAIEANAASFALVGTVLALSVSLWWLALPLAVTSFLLLHALMGWCPPVPVLRRLGFRTPREIEEERHALLSRVESRPAAVAHANARPTGAYPTPSRATLGPASDHRDAAAGDEPGKQKSQAFSSAN